MHATSLVLASALCSVALAAPQPAPYFRGGFALGNRLGAREPLSNSNDFAKPAFVNNKKVGVPHNLDRRLSNSNDFAKPAFINNNKVGVRHDIDRRLSNSNDFGKPAFVNNKKIPRQDSGIHCAPVDDDGAALTASAGSGDFVTCTYAGAGLCAYFPADGSFSSGGSSCPQGVAQDPSATTDGASAIGASPTDTPDEPTSASGDAPESPPPSIPTSSSSVSAPASTPPTSTPASTPASGSASAGAPASPPAGSQTSAAASQTPSQSGAAMRLGPTGGGMVGMQGVLVAVVGIMIGAFVL